MDLLYYLQTLRLSAPGWLNSLLVAISESVLILAPLIAAVIYWCADKKKGTYLAWAIAVAFLCNELVKVTACVYRPWILDSRLFPAAEVIETATNYSFPSGHSCITATLMTGLTLSWPDNRKLRVFSIVFTLTVLFSRMYLGCHSLLDVCCGALLGFASAFLLRPMLTEGFDEERFTRMLIPVSCTLTLITILYVYFKSYPLDYQADGSLLVDPAAMRPDTVGACGILSALGIGFYLERTKIHFAMPETKQAAFLRALPGALVFALLYVVILKKLFSPLDPALSKFLRYFLCLLFVSAGYPWICKRFRF